MAEFVIGRLKFVWRNAWASSALYRKDDVVRYGAKLHMLLLQTQSQMLIFM